MNKLLFLFDIFSVNQQDCDNPQQLSQTFYDDLLDFCEQSFGAKIPKHYTRIIEGNNKDVVCFHHGHLYRLFHSETPVLERTMPCIL